MRNESAPKAARSMSECGTPFYFASVGNLITKNWKWPASFSDRRRQTPKTRRRFWSASVRLCWRRQNSETSTKESVRIKLLILTRSVSFEVAISAAERRPRIAVGVGVSPRFWSNTNLSREAAPADAIAVAASRLNVLSSFVLRADARSYVLPSLRDSQLCNFKERQRGTGLRSVPLTLFGL